MKNRIKAIAGLISTISFLSLAQPAKGDIKSMCLSSELVKVIDRYTVVCRDESKEIDGVLVSLRRFNSNLKTMTWVSVVFTNKYPKSRLVTIDASWGQSINSQIIQFWLTGRTFEKWESTPNRKLINQYKNEVSMLLDIVEEPPMKF
ncbi:hypothetical protein [Chlorogloeopsis fritschii]|uniref:hypothetical protein n=1 Tax=Chlorogloeopsis fritschii TaxID=1124 RepID=UPI000F8DF3D0|nr:hypothetical protein [Chlorogloeopsis fritschii]